VYSGVSIVKEGMGAKLKILEGQKQGMCAKILKGGKYFSRRGQMPPYLP